MNIIDIPCKRENFGGLRASAVKYLVIHYTAGRNDTAQDNGEYFAREQVGASAHYFVDEDTVVRSVPEDYVAWHCGASYYVHPKCRNSNSIGIEICTKLADGQYGFAPEAVALAQELARQLMQKYNIPVDRLIRHWDVSHKVCPAPFVGKGQAAWEEFKGGLILYEKLENVPEWAKPSIEKLVNKGILQGNGAALNLSQDLTRTLVILDRLGVLDK